MKRESLVKWGVAGLFLVATTLLIHVYVAYVPYGLRYVNTPSIPTGFYLSKAYDQREPLKDGEFVCFKPTYPAWEAARLTTRARPDFCKQVLGLPGDYVIAKGDERIRLRDGKARTLGVVLHTDQQGRPAFAADLPIGPIPMGQYWMTGLNHPRSFDSRYLGLVPQSAVTAVITPLF